MKISFITTVLNEQKTINSFLISLREQSIFPDEIIIVDGGSRDKTFSEILNFKFSIFKNRVKVFKKIGNRSVGRNEAIKQAKGDIILVSDVGCILDKQWIKRIIEPFEDKSVEVVSGYYYPKTSNVFEKCLSTYTCVMPDKINPKNFLPSSRSVAFKKKAWIRAGGYPENLDTCEDLVFAKRMKNMGIHFVFQKSAYVYWPQRSNIKDAFMQFYSYAKGDGTAFYIRKQTPFLFIRGLLFLSLLMYSFRKQSIACYLILVGVIIIYCAYSIIKNYRYVRESKAIYILPVIQLTSDIAVSSGMFLGLLSSAARLYKAKSNIKDLGNI